VKVAKHGGTPKKISGLSGKEIKMTFTIQTIDDDKILFNGVELRVVQGAHPISDAKYTSPPFDNISAWEVSGEDAAGNVYFIKWEFVVDDPRNVDIDYLDWEDVSCITVYDEHGRKAGEEGFHAPENAKCRQLSRRTTRYS
jgi:hypothetical protein